MNWLLLPAFSDGGETSGWTVIQISAGNANDFKHEGG
jgi:hypothetical protein